MRNYLLLLALLPALAVAGYLFIAPGFLSDYRWLIIALPVALAFVRELYDPSTDRPSTGRSRMVGIPLDPLDDRFAAGEDDRSDGQLESIDGLWAGTVRIWPGKPDEVLQLLPLRMIITDEGRNASVILSGNAHEDPSVTDACILEYSPRDGHLDMKLVLNEGGRLRDLEVDLTLADNYLVPGDDTRAVTAEFQRTAPAALLIA